MTLDLETFDETPFTGVIPPLEAQGFYFFSLAEQAGGSQAALSTAARKLHAVNYTTVLDIPGWEGDWLSFEAFEKNVMGADWFDPRGQFCVSDGDPAQGAPWVGLSAVRLVSETGGAYNLMTGVLREYRGGSWPWRSSWSPSATPGATGRITCAPTTTRSTRQCWRSTVSWVTSPGRGSTI